MIKNCVFDADGKLINIGDWDYVIRPVQVGTQTVVVKEAVTDEDGNIVEQEVTEEHPVFEDQVTNPLPVGAVIEQREVCQNADGGWCLAEDYVKLRKAAYPPYSPFDILDEVLKQITPEPGSKLEQIQLERLAVKAQYPKPE